MGHMGNFDGHDEITEIIFPSTLKDTGMHTFSYLKNLKKVVINKGLEYISQSALRCPSLTEIYIPSTVKRIDSGALINDYGLTIICHEDSAAHDYAVEKKIAFKLLPREGEKPVKPIEPEIFTNKQENGTVRHIVCICYDGPLSNQWKPQIQEFIINSETKAGSVINQMSRITFDSFYDNAELHKDFSLKMKMTQIYGETYGFKDADAFALKSVYKGAMLQEDEKTIKAKYFVLYE